MRPARRVRIKKRTGPGHRKGEKANVTGRRRRTALAGTLALTVIVIVGLMLGGAVVAAKKKKKKKPAGGTVDITKLVGTAIPDVTATTNGVLASTIDVAATKQFRGTRIRDVNVTLTTLGLTGATPADNLEARLTAPDGTTVWLFGDASLIAGVSIGPLTFDDQSLFALGGLPPAPDSTTLVSPYIGSAQPDCFAAHGGCALANMSDRAVTGTWTLRLYDVATTAETSSLVSWRLVVIAGKPFKTK